MLVVEISFSEKEPLTVCIGEKEIIPVESYVIKVPSEKKEDIIDTLLCAGYLKWNREKVKNAIEEREEKILQKHKRPKTSVEKNRILSTTNEHTLELNKLYYYEISLAEKGMPRSVDFDSDWHLLDLAIENEIFFETIKKLKKKD